MAIQQETLRNLALLGRIRETLAASAAQGKPTAFLCHSHKDQELAIGLQLLLREAGLDLYIDWQDATMPDKPSRETAARLRQRILRSAWFLFLATANSTSSRWCPWELGYADGTKNLDSILVVPTRDSSGLCYGNEYLALYRRIDVAMDGSLITVQPGDATGTYVRYLR